MSGMPDADCTASSSDPIAIGDPLQLLNEAGSVIGEARGMPTTQWQQGPYCVVDFYFDVPPGEPFLEFAPIESRTGDAIGGVRRENTDRVFTVHDIKWYGNGQVAYFIPAADL